MKASNRFLLSTIIVIVVAVAVGFFYLNNKIQISQHPTQDEWLKVYISQSIHNLTDLWQQNVAVSVVIFSQDADKKPLIPKEIVITMAFANGEEPITKIDKDQYTGPAESIAKSILEDYGVTKEYKLTVQFID